MTTLSKYNPKTCKGNYNWM